MVTYTYTQSFSAITVMLLCLGFLPCFGQSQALLNSNKKTVTRYFDEVINTHRLDQIGEFFSKDYIWHTPDGKDVHSSQDSAHITMKRQVFNAIPDVHWAINHIVAEGDMVAINTTVTGTPKPEMFGLPAGQKKVSFRQMFFYRLKNNKITEQWEVVDLDGLKTQLTSNTKKE